MRWRYRSFASHYGCCSCTILSALLLISCFIFSLYGKRGHFLADSSLTISVSSRGNSVDTANQPKRIILWTTIFNQKVAENVLSECGNDLKKKCVLTSQRDNVDQAAAVVFHAADIMLEDLPQLRHVSQRYVFMTMEVPPNHKEKALSFIPENFFNWSMTYRRDVDIPMPYGGWWLNPVISKTLNIEPEHLVFDKSEIMKGKTKSIYWLVSNCNTISKRELAVERLAQYVPVNIFGKCSKEKKRVKICKHGAKCEETLAKEHFFFLALENTVCEDYITEKYWSRYHLPSVPIVMKRYIYEKLLPPNSFIPMDDFKSPKEMANYLQMLMSNESAYLSYYSWRSAGWSHPWQIPGYRLGYCKLCEKLLDDKSPKVINNITKWFYETGNCEFDGFAQSWI